MALLQLTATANIVAKWRRQSATTTMHNGKKYERHCSCETNLAMQLWKWINYGTNVIRRIVRSLVVETGIGF